MAIIERLPGHTEVMGSFASLALELGFEPHLLFNPKDPYHVVDYLKARLPIPSDHVHDWSYIAEVDSSFEYIVLNTSVVWLEQGFRLQQWNAAKRLVVVHHLPDDVELNPYGASLYLTPAVDRKKWIFPLYRGFSEVGKSENTNGKSDRPSETKLPTLVTIGSLDLKDVSDVSNYLKCGGEVLHYDRHPCRFFPGVAGYRQHIGLSGSAFMASLSQQERPMFLWFPIAAESHYLVFRFCGALIIGVDMNCVMVMPDRLRQLYGFPQEAVIAYQSSVTEAACLEKLRESSQRQGARRERLREWALDRWRENLTVFRTALGLQGS